MTYTDMETKYFSKRKSGKDRKYYDSLDELYKSENRLELVGRKIIASWVGIVNNPVLIMK